MLLPYPPPLALGGDIAGTKVSLGATGLWPTCPWSSSFWPQLSSMGFTGASARLPQGLPCGLGDLSLTCF